MERKVILHCDLNNFYASVETVLHPEYKGKPLAVCGDPKKRHGIVLAKSMPAKIMGVKTGDTVWEAMQKCPDLTIVTPTYNEYVKYSDIVFRLYTQYTDRVEHFGMDECWLDVTGSAKLFGDGKNIADELRRRVYEETGLTISVGVSFTKCFAKLGSDMKKPDATTVIDADNYKKIVWPLNIDEMIFIGRSTTKKLNLLNINTLGELACADRELLRAHFGIIADKIVDAAAGLENEPVKFYYDCHIPKSVGHGTTTTKDICDLHSAQIVVYSLSERVATRLRKYNLQADCVSVSMRDCNLNSFTRQTTLPCSTNNAKDIAEAAVKLLAANCNFAIPLRSISVYTSRLTSTSDWTQTSIFDVENSKEKRLEESVDKIREKYGYKSVQRASLLNNGIIDTELLENEEFEPFKR